MSRELLNYIYKLNVIVVCRDGIFWFNNPNRVNWLEIIYYWLLLLLCLLLKYYLLKNDMKINERFEKMYHPPTICRHGLLFIFIHKINHSLMFLVFFSFIIIIIRMSCMHEQEQEVHITWDVLVSIVKHSWLDK